MSKEDANESIDHEIGLLQSKRERLTERLESCQRLGFQAEVVNITTRISLISSFIFCLQRVKSYVNGIEFPKDE